MTKLEYDDGTVVWRRSRLAQLLWVGGIATWIATVTVIPDIELDERIAFVLLGCLAAAFAWWRVWRPHLAVTRDGIIVRYGTGAVHVPWSNVAEAQVWSIYGVNISVRTGEPVSSDVPRRGILQLVLNLDSEADRAVRRINELVSTHRRQPAPPPGPPGTAQT